MSVMDGKLFGITHSVEDGRAIIREPRVLKVGIGLPKGRALNVWTQRNPEGAVVWKMQRGFKNDESTKVATLKTRAEAEAKFAQAYADAPICSYPRKLGYFTFTKPSMIDGKEQYIPDFSAIESHGPLPTEIDIVLLDDQPFSGMFQMWSSSELQCRGDGVDAFRVLKLARTEEEKAAAALAGEAGEKVFPIVRGCWTNGCPYAQAGMKDGKEVPSACKPGGDLKFQIACALRVGGTAFFHTTGFRSISGIFSSLYRISQLTGGRLRGVPLKMVLRPFRTNHNNQGATQYAVALEFRAPDVETMRQRLLESAFAFRELATGEQQIRLIDAPASDTPETDEEDDQPMSAESMVNEFYPQNAEPGPVDMAASSPSAPIAAASETKAAALGEKMAAARKRTRAQAAAPLTAPEMPAQAEAPAAAAPTGAAPTVTTPSAAPGGAPGGAEDLF